MAAIYKWYLAINEVETEVYPIYKDDLSLDYEKESGERFFRSKLSSKITFVGADADLILAQPFTTEFVIEARISMNYGTSYSTLWLGHFYMTDCTVNLNDKKVTVQPSPKDRYCDILAGMDKEFDLIKLAPAIQPILAAKRPMFQLYTVGDDKVTCLCGGNSFERDVTDGSAERAVDCHFKPFGTYWEINFPGTTVQGLEYPFAGAFTEAGSQFDAVDTTYRIEYYEQSVAIPNLGRYDNINGLKIIDNSDDSVFAEFVQSHYADTQDDFLAIPAEIVFGDGTNTYTAVKTEYDGFYGRIVMDERIISVGGAAYTAYKIGADDMVASNQNYKYCLGFTGFDYQQSQRTSQTPTKWGLNDQGLYFLPPDDTHAWYPANRSQWVNTSMWINYDATITAWETAARHPYIIKDTFPLWSVLSVLLAEVAPSVTFAGTSTYSEFLYGERMASAAFGTRPFISPKSNVIMGEYQEPAQKAPTTLGEILTMLKRVYNCYWFIDDNNRLRIEHVRFFEQGGSYASAATVGTDLTTLINVRNRKPWAFGKSEYSFQKEEMPATYQYAWMDEVTELFKGNPINVQSPFVQQGKVEDVTVANFTSDIDYMLMAPELCSKDGFALLQAESNPVGWQLPISGTSLDGVYTYYLQNYLVAMYYLQMYYLLWDMPAWTVEVNGSTTQVGGIYKGKRQQVVFPAQNIEPNLLRLVRTGIGDGEIERYSVSFSSRMVKATLKYKSYEYVAE